MSKLPTKRFELIYFNQEHGCECSYTLGPFGVHQCDSVWSAFSERYLDDNGEGKLYPNGLGYYPIVDARLEQVA